MTVLITGGSGKLGCELLKIFPDAIAPTHKEMDITNSDQVFKCIDHYKPTIIIHTAALTDIRFCELNWKEAENVNVGGTWHVLNAAEHVGAKIIFISTACVFDGEMGPYSETDRPGPKNYYALSKYAAEQLVQRYKRHLIVRTNFVPYSPWPYPAAFTDRYGTYLFAHDVARAIPTTLSIEGIVHICGEDEMSMYNLARLTTHSVLPMTLDDYSGPPLTRDMRLISNLFPPIKISGGDSKIC